MPAHLAAAASEYPRIGKPKYCVRNVQGHQRNQKICRLGNEIGGSILCWREIAGIKPHHQEHQQLGAKGAYAHQQGIGCKGLILVHFVLKDFPVWDYPGQ